MFNRNDFFVVIITFLMLLRAEIISCGKISGNVLVNSALNCQVGNLTTPEGFTYTPTAAASSKEFAPATGSVGFIGDVNDVLQGIVTQETESNVWKGVSSTGAFGFGAAAIGSLAGMGETMFVNGQAIVRQTDNGTFNYFQTITGEEFRTPFAVFIKNGSQPDGKAIYFTRNRALNISVSDFYTRVHEVSGRSPFCFYGLTKFSQMDAIAVSKAPIYSEPLFGDTLEGYYSQPPFQLHNQYGLLFGCVANFSTVQDVQLSERLRRLLYLNPLDSGATGQLQVHIHALTLRNCLKTPEQIGASNVADVFHLLSNSTINFIDARIFKMETVDELVQLNFKARSGEGVSGALALAVENSAGRNFKILSIFAFLSTVTALLFGLRV